MKARQKQIIPMTVNTALTVIYEMGLYIAFWREALPLKTSPKKKKLYMTILMGQLGKPHLLSSSLVSKFYYFLNLELLVL